MKIFLLQILLFLFCIIISCNVNSTHCNGGATETVNASVIINDTTVTVTLKSEKPVMADIKILSENYNPVFKKGFIDSVSSIPSDSFAVFNLEEGNYNMMIYERLSEKAIVINNIHSGKAVSESYSDSLKYLGSISGTVNVVSMVYFRGTPYCTKTDSNGKFMFSKVPSGTLYITAAALNIVTPSVNDVVPSVGRYVEIKSMSSTDDVMLFFSK